MLHWVSPYEIETIAARRAEDYPRANRRLAGERRREPRAGRGALPLVGRFL